MRTIDVKKKLLELSEVSVNVNTHHDAVIAYCQLLNEIRKLANKIDVTDLDN